MDSPQNPIRISPYRLVFGKPCYLPTDFSIRHIGPKNLNFDLDSAAEEETLVTLKEKFSDAYDLANDYKIRTKKVPDCKILHKNFKLVQLLLLFNSILKLIL